MANTYTSLHYHIVFSTKNRAPWLVAAKETRIWEYLGGIARTNGMKALKVVTFFTTWLVKPGRQFGKPCFKTLHEPRGHRGLFFLTYLRMTVETYLFTVIACHPLNLYGLL